MQADKDILITYTVERFAAKGGMIDFLLYSNLILACGAAIVSYTTAFVLGVPIVWEVLFIPFAGSFFIYTLNRYTDKNEDGINVPNRVEFFTRHGKWLLAISLAAYFVSIAIALSKGFLVFVFSILPLCIGLVYSFLGLKKILVAKNLSVGFAWGFSVLLVGALYNNFALETQILFVFFATEFFVNTVIFDMKDIQGDRRNKIITLPVKLGIKNTQYICYIFNSAALALIITSVVLGLLPGHSLILCIQSIYIFIYTYLSSEKCGRLFWGLFVDGEFIFLLMVYLSAVSLKIM